jgi:hypothetical protein
MPDQNGDVEQARCQADPAQQFGCGKIAQTLPDHAAERRQPQADEQQA